MTEEEAKRKATYLIDNGYVIDRDFETLVKEILQSINKGVSRDTPISTNSSTEEE